MVDFGDMNWAAASGGKVNGLERGRQILEALRFQVVRYFHRKPKAFGVASAGELERILEEIELPKTLLVSRAATLVTELGPPALTGHVFRTWAWGVVFALRDGLRFDREAFALGALLHDVALTRRSTGVTCFAADGAGQAVSLLRAWGGSEDLVSTVGNAICLHVRVAVPPTLGTEAHLVHAGAGVDVIGGARFAEIPEDVRERILRMYPRLEMKAFLLEALRREQREHPASRMALWVSMGFLDRIRRAPYDEP
jgi:hypothetical protein